MHSRSLFTAAVALSALASCGDCGTDPTHKPGAGLPVADPDSGSQVISCGVDDDCPFGQVCRAGLCQPSDPSLHDEGCWRDADCNAGYRCAVSSGRCVPLAASPDAALPPAGDCASGTARHCGSKVGLCAYGSEECVAGHWSGSCSGGVRPVDELCDGLDNDCDADVDETFTLGGRCFNGLGVCRQLGLTTCSSDHLSTVCDAVALDATGRVELCGNGADDNCDGQTDEGFAQLDGACSAGVGACLRSGTFICSDDLHTLRCSATAGTAAPAELCGNDVDDNCDGQTDEGFDGVAGTVCTVGAPPCQTDGQWICSTDRTALECELPAALIERCNNTDDDSDSCIDEGFDVGAACTVGQGVCRASGTKICRADELATTCAATPGLPNPFGELCGNGLDDDCDGSIDEGFDTVGTACAAGTGACRSSGSIVCASDGRGTVCNAQPGTPGSELCGNAVDENCDGQLDDGFDLGAACTSGTGACQRSGVKVCASDGRSAVCDATPGTAGTELCGNGIDDDCDTYTDEGFGNLGNGCTAGVGACVASGVYVCSTDRLSTVCNATPGTPTGERCDNLDNDCDNAVDDGCDDDRDGYCDVQLTLVGAPAVCPSTTGAATQDCNDADATVHPGAAEICGDSRDQNCDGSNSEGCPSCNPSVDDDLDGSNQCVDCDETNGSVHPGATERCNGIDDDCDTELDEDFDHDNDSFTTCGTVLPGGGLNPAYVDCDDNNSARHPFACELCALAGVTVACNAQNDGGNNVDEDCDGWRDEGCSPCDPVDRDGDGVSACQGDCAAADGAVAPGRAELCDGKDNDCNAFTTENCDVGDTCAWPTEETDVCRDRLICVQSLGPSGRPTGDYTCTSLCNFSQAGLGLGDGCASNQTCSSSLTPTANLHGCSVATDFGAKAAGLACSRDTECRSGLCLSDGRFVPKQEYCTDLCGSDAYCANGTICQIGSSFTGRCLKTTSIQTRDVGVACNDTNGGYYCRYGYYACVEVSTGNKKCSKPCCNNGECPSGYFCSLNGNDAPGPIGGYDTVPVCWPNAASGAHNRVAGQACAANNECESEFCDRILHVCVDLCCNDSNCPTGLTCESALVTRANGHQGFSRVCVNLTPADALQPL